MLDKNRFPTIIHEESKHRETERYGSHGTGNNDNDGENDENKLTEHNPPILTVNDAFSKMHSSRKLFEN